MSEKDIIVENMPQLTALAELLSYFSEEEFEAWKQEVLASSSESTRPFTEKVVALIEKALE